MHGPLKEKFTRPVPGHICEFTAQLINRGALKLNRAANEGLTVTLHDPCHLARSADLLSEMRLCLQNSVPSFIEMPKQTIRENTLCCGGGGGLMAPELLELRIRGAQPRMEALKESGATFLAAPCATCRKAFDGALSHYNEKVGYFQTPVSVSGIHDLIYRALVL